MPLPAPNLDDRTFQQLVDECKRRIPLYCPEWTDHNVSDPGVTLIELFAYMTEQLLFRLNQVPEKNYIKFLDLLQIKLEPAETARVALSFALSAPQPQAITIARGTEVSTVQTEVQEGIIFTTDEDLVIDVPQLRFFLTSATGEDSTLIPKHAFLRERPRQLPLLFENLLVERSVFYLGFTGDISNQTLALSMEGAFTGEGINPENPPLAWEYWDGKAWDEFVPVRRFEEQLDVGSKTTSTAAASENTPLLLADTSEGLNKPNGLIILQVPGQAEARLVGESQGWWIRCRLTRGGDPRKSVYTKSPSMRRISAAAVGGTVRASHSVRVIDELVGVSNGEAGQTFKLQHAPILNRMKEEEYVEVELEDVPGFEHWTEEVNFFESTGADKHYTIDSISGEISFGPMIRNRNGGNVQHGAIPPRLKQIRMAAYSYGGGAKGNVPRRSLVVLKSAIPYIASVTNYYSAVGGADAETLDSAKLRAPEQIRTRDRAVTALDYELLAKEASSSVARAKCLQPRSGDDVTSPPGMVTVLIIPDTAQTEDRSTPEQFRLPPEVQQRVSEYLNERRLLTASLKVRIPDYKWVQTELSIKVREKANASQVKDIVRSKLMRFINPLMGGPDGDGWPFERDLFVADIYAAVQSVAGVEYVSDVKLYTVNPNTATPGSALQKITVPPLVMICSWDHLVNLVQLS